eukprot:jgi/Psemu1/56216/gm1.56216_g
MAFTGWIEGSPSKKTRPSCAGTTYSVATKLYRGGRNRFGDSVEGLCADTFVSKWCEKNYSVASTTTNGSGVSHSTTEAPVAAAIPSKPPQVFLYKGGLGRPPLVFRVGDNLDAMIGDMNLFSSEIDDEDEQC